MSESSSKFADGKHALEAVDRAEGAAREAAQHARTAAGRVTIQDFEKRVDAYVQQRKRVESKLEQLKATPSTEKICPGSERPKSASSAYHTTHETTPSSTEASRMRAVIITV